MNPELRRYAWLDLGLHEIVIAPVVLAALAAMAVAASDKPATLLAWGSLTVFLVITGGWGCLRAWASVTDEVRDRTWDFQRMAAIPSSRIALGKVFGAPLLQWYVGGWCLVVFAFAAPRAQLPHVAATLVALVATCVMLHALGVAGSAISARAMLANRARRAGGFVAFILLVNIVPAPLAVLFGSDGAAQTTWWWGMQLSSHAFLALTSSVFAAWALLGATRSMAREFREPVRWGAWPAFALFLAAWLVGLHGIRGLSSVAGFFAIVAVVLAFATYVGLALDPLGRVALARWRHAARRVPGWVLDAALGVAAGLVAIGVGLAGRPSHGVLPWQSPAAPAFALAVALMAVRDAAIVSCFSLSSKIRSPLGRAAFHIALADLLAPLMLYSLGQPQLALLVFPLWAFSGESLFPVWAMAVHAAVALAVLGWRVASVRDLAPSPPGNSGRAK